MAKDLPAPGTVSGPVFSPATNRAFQNATEMLAEMIDAGQGWEIGTADPIHLPWGLEDHLGMAFNRGRNEVTPEKVAWLQEQGWIAQVFKGRIILAPLVFVSPPPTCFHTTPAENVPGILARGLLTGIAAGRSTSNRQDCAGNIHVTFDMEAARKRAGDTLLGKTSSSREWAILRVNAQSLPGRVFRDPASSTGYILEENQVPSSRILSR